MKIDAFGGGQTLAAIQVNAPRVEQAGFDGLWIPESAADVFAVSSIAALTTKDLELGTGIAVAFARSPMLTAQAAWMLAEATKGKFYLGLGTQVKPHVERRYSAAFDPPGPRMREYVLALREIFAAFARRKKLSFKGDYYNFSLLPEMWSPPKIPYPDPPILLAGVRPWMCRMIGEVADGMKIHPLHSMAYLDDLVLPNLAVGAAKAGRSVADLNLVAPVMTAASDDPPTLAKLREQMRARLAFYASTPGYGVVFDASGWPGIGEACNALMREGKVQEMTALITDEMVEAMTISGAWAELPKKLVDKYRGKVSRIVCYSTLSQWDEDPSSVERWQDVVRETKRLCA